MLEFQYKVTLIKHTPEGKEDIGLLFNNGKPFFTNSEDEAFERYEKELDNILYSVNKLYDYRKMSCDFTKEKDIQKLLQSNQEVWTARVIRLDINPVNVSCLTECRPFAFSENSYYKQYGITCRASSDNFRGEEEYIIAGYDENNLRLGAVRIIATKNVSVLGAYFDRKLQEILGSEVVARKLETKE